MDELSDRVMGSLGYRLLLGACRLGWVDVV